METPDDIPADILRAHLDEVRRRVAEVESGVVALIPGDQALAEVSRIIDATCQREGKDRLRKAIMRDEELTAGAVKGRSHEDVMQAARRAIGCE